MKIAILSAESMYSIPISSVALQVSGLATALQKLGNEVHVFTLRGVGQGDYQLYSGVHYHRCSFDSDGNLTDQVESICSSFIYHLRSTEEYIGSKFDVIHGHDWLICDALGALKAEHSGRIVWTVYSPERRRRFSFPLAKRTVEEVGPKWYVPECANRIIATSEALKDKMVMEHGVADSMMDVVYPGVDVRKFSRTVDAGKIKQEYAISVFKPTLLYVGKLSEARQPHLLLESIPAVLEKYPHVIFLFVGDGELSSYLRDRTTALQVSHSVRFIGYLSEADLIDLYNACDVVYVPTKKGSEYEISRVMLEAWSASKPVITTIGTSNDKLLWHEVNSFISESEPNSIASGIKSAFSDFDRIKWMGGNGRRAVYELCNWDNVALKVISIYQKLGSL
ncbi:glycosyltransferase family 4 protein [bacterium]|nr:glycosyltransferase family 4 protein [bacterium]